MQFNIVICGLDSIEARRWINSTLVDLVDDDNPESLKPLIDGGTEGGHSCLLTTRNVTERTLRIQGSIQGNLPNHNILHRVPT